MTKLLLYCTKAKPYLVQGFAKPMHTLDAINPFNFNWILVNKGFSNDRLNNKIVAECDFEVEEIETLHNSFMTLMQTETLTEDNILKSACLTFDELDSYLKKKCGYAIHIKNLHIFDKPRELSNYLLTKVTRGLTYGFYNTSEIENERVIVITVSPQEACRILNKEQDIIVRKVVLKKMLK